MNVFLDLQNENSNKNQMWYSKCTTDIIKFYKKTPQQTYFLP